MLTVGKRFRALRKERDLTLVELAERSGIDQATISRIETGRMVGTLESHQALAQALGLTLAELYEGIEEEGPERITVQTEAPAAEVAVHAAGQANWRLLTREVLKKKMMPVLVTVDPRGTTSCESLPFGSERFIYVLDGKLHLQIGEEPFILAPTQTVYFDAHLPHTLRNPAGHAVKCLVMTTPPAL